LLFSFSAAIGFFLFTPICDPPLLRRFTQGLAILRKPLFGLLFPIKTALHVGNESYIIEFLFPLPDNFSSNWPVFVGAGGKNVHKSQGYVLMSAFNYTNERPCDQFEEAAFCLHD